MKKRMIRILLLCVFCCSLNACITYRVTQLFQATAVIEGFYSALNAGDIDKSVGFYSEELRGSVGLELLKEGLTEDAERLGVFVDYQIRKWSLEKGLNNESQLVLVCDVAYERGRTQEIFTVRVGGEEKIITHEINSERLKGGAFDI